MGGDIETIKERLDIAEIVGGYVKLEKAGTSFKARCPFHNEKTPSFFVSPLRQSYYCFGCGAKGDIFTFVEQTEGLDFREALVMLAERAGVELKRSTPEASALKSEKEKVLEVLHEAMMFFEKELEKCDEAKKYIKSRGISDESAKAWNLGYAPAEWRALYSEFLAKGYSETILIKAGLIKRVDQNTGKQPYDVFRDRIIFPLRDPSGRVIAFSGRALAKDTEPKYLNSPDSLVFTKHSVLYGLDKAKEKIRRKDYAVLVEGQMDLVLSHQVGVDNTVASSGTAFTQSHLEKLKKLSRRIILAFDGDKAGEAAAEKSAELAMSLNLEVKIADLPQGEDPAEIAVKDPGKWKDVLRYSKPAIEHFLRRLASEEKDMRKLGLNVVRKILPLIALLESSTEKSYFVSLVAKHTGIKEDVLWDDLRKVKSVIKLSSQSEEGKDEVIQKSKKESIQERLNEVRSWLREIPADNTFKREEAELERRLAQEGLREELSSLAISLARAETSRDAEKIDELTKRISSLHREIRELEDADSNETAVKK